MFKLFLVNNFFVFIPAVDDYVNSNADKLKGLNLNQRHFQGTKLLLSFKNNNVIPNSIFRFFKNNFMKLKKNNFKSFNYFVFINLSTY